MMKKNGVMILLKLYFSYDLITFLFMVFYFSVIHLLVSGL